MLVQHSLYAPGPHPFLLVLQLRQFTPQEQRVMETTSDEVNEYTVVLFTGRERLKNILIDEFIQQDTILPPPVQKCNSRMGICVQEQCHGKQQSDQSF